MHPACNSSRSPSKNPASRPISTTRTVRRTAFTLTGWLRASHWLPRRSNWSRPRRQLGTNPSRPRADARKSALMKIAFIVDPLDDFKIYKDSTFAMMREAAARRHDVYALQQEDVVWHAGAVTGHAQKLHLTGDPAALYRADAVHATALKEVDAGVMRKDPPFD